MAVLTNKGIDKTALAGIGTSHDSKARQALLFILLAVGAQRLDNKVQEVARTTARSSGDTLRITKS